MPTSQPVLSSNGVTQSTVRSFVPSSAYPAQSVRASFPSLAPTACCIVTLGVCVAPVPPTPAPSLPSAPSPLPESPSDELQPSSTSASAEPAATAAVVFHR